MLALITIGDSAHQRRSFHRYAGNACDLLSACCRLPVQPASLPHGGVPRFCAAWRSAWHMACSSRDPLSSWAPSGTCRSWPSAQVSCHRRPRHHPHPRTHHLWCSHVPAGRANHRRQDAVWPRGLARPPSGVQLSTDTVLELSLGLLPLTAVHGTAQSAQGWQSFTAGWLVGGLSGVAWGYLLTVVIYLYVHFRPSMSAAKAG